MRILTKTLLLLLIVSAMTNYLFFSGLFAMPVEPHAYSKKERKAFDQLVSQYVEPTAAEVFGYDLPAYIPDTKLGGQQ